MRLKEILKKGTALLCGAVLLFCAAVPVVFGKTTVEARLEELIDQWNGTYWTTDGNPSDSSGSTSRYYYGIQCKGFANYIFYQLFDVPFIGRYDQDCYYLPDPSGAVELAREWDFGAEDTKLMERIFASARPGDFIQGRSRKGSYGHTMIFLSQDETGITVFDCNWDNQCGVAVRQMSWEKLASYFMGLSLYTAENYPSQPVDVTAPVISNAQAVLGQEGYLVTCTVTDDVGVDRVYFPSWHEGQDAGESAVWYLVDPDEEQYAFLVPYQTDSSGQPVYGTYYTHIYAYDAAGNYSVTGLWVDRPLPTPDFQPKPPSAATDPDVNGDGERNVLDVMTLAQYVVQPSGEFNPDWDFSENGVLDVLDVMELSRQIASAFS